MTDIARLKKFNTLTGETIHLFVMIFFGVDLFCVYVQISDFKEFLCSTT